MENIGQKIRKLRELRNYTQEYMAINLNITQTAYCKIEKEESRLTLERLKAISEVLELDPIQILTFDEKIFLFKAFPKNEVVKNVENKEQMNTRMCQLEDEITMLRRLFSQQQLHS